MKESALPEIVSFGDYGIYEITDEPLLNLIGSGKGLQMPPTTEANVMCDGSNSRCGNEDCLNRSCGNEVCIGGGNDIFC